MRPGVLARLARLVVTASALLLIAGGGAVMFAAGIALRWFAAGRLELDGARALLDGRPLDGWPETLPAA